MLNWAGECKGETVFIVRVTHIRSLHRPRQSLDLIFFFPADKKLSQTPTRVFL